MRQRSSARQPRVESPQLSFRTGQRSIWEPGKRNSSLTCGSIRPAGEQELAEPDKTLGDVAVGEELFEEVERGAVLPVGAEAVAQFDRVGEGALWGREIEEDPVYAVGLAVGGLEGVMELFPVAGAEPPVLGGGQSMLGK